MTSENTPQETFLTIVDMLEAISLRRELPSLSRFEPFHLLLVGHCFSSVHVADLEKTIIAPAIVTPFRVRIELTLVIYKSDSRDNRRAVSVYGFQVLHLSLAREHKIFPVLSIEASAIVRIWIYRLFYFASDLISASDDVWIVLDLSFRECLWRFFFG